MYEIVSPDVLSLDVFLLLFFLESIKIFISDQEGGAISDSFSLGSALRSVLQA